MNIHDSDYIFVWEEPPTDTHGFVPLVRAANGESATTPWNFAHNYAAWASHLGYAPPAWTYIYSRDSGEQVAKALLGSAPHAPFYIIDVEDQGIEHANLHRCAATLKVHGPVGITTYGLVKQCVERRLPIDAWVWDIVMPQLYYPYQRNHIAQWRARGKVVTPAVAPNDDPSWTSNGDRNRVAVWRAGIVKPGECAQRLHNRRVALDSPLLPRPDSEHAERVHSKHIETHLATVEKEIAHVRSYMKNNRL